jgi:hypothetical protein
MRRNNCCARVRGGPIPFFQIDDLKIGLWVQTMRRNNCCAAVWFGWVRFFQIDDLKIADATKRNNCCTRIGPLTPMRFFQIGDLKIGQWVQNMRRNNCCVQKRPDPIRFFQIDDLKNRAMGTNHSTQQLLRRGAVWMGSRFSD